ncbi:ArsR/SmtB family transcription factor [Actinophytocola sp.]|jgi:DNA-binding transcriptional ArsR family regulator|uniref:ArsR/SmtB family transcription factor n=1 Tax=Actinophytocola sp. TaxID=1872138 RepID=UPI002ED79F0F
MKHIELDSRALRVLAHPLRSRLLSELRLHGAANATALAERLDTNTGATSYHLRKLAEVGLVEETAEGTGKQRFWAAAQDSHGWRNTDYPDDPDAQAAASWLRQQQLRYLAERAEEWEQERARWPEAWQDAASMSDAILTVDAGQLDELMHELYAVLLRYREMTPGEGSQQVVVHVVGMPADPRNAP